VGVGRRAASFQTAALIDRDIDENGAFPSCCAHLLGAWSSASGRTGHKDGADDCGPAENTASRSPPPSKSCLCRRLKQFVELAQPRERAVEDRHIGAKTNRHSARLGFPRRRRRATATRAGGTPGTPPSRRPRPPFLALRAVQPLGREASRDLAHRWRERQALASGPVTVS